MLSIWFMFDNHTFARIKGRDRATIIKQATELFKEECGSGSLFVRDEYDGTLVSLNLNGHRLANGMWGVTKKEIETWADKVMEETSFRTLMA